LFPPPPPESSQPGKGSLGELHSAQRAAAQQPRQQLAPPKHVHPPPEQLFMPHEQVERESACTVSQATSSTAAG
jgi:hypothetical protein